MTIVADVYTHIVGVDTHARTHTYAVLDTRTSAVEATDVFPTTLAGMRRAITWIKRRTGDATTLLVIECIGSYGAQLAKLADQTGYTVVEPLPVAAGVKAGKGKSDPLDAGWIARSVLGADTDRLRQPRDDEGTRAALRVLIVARDMITADHTRTVNALTALARTIDLGVDARRPLTKTQITQIAAWRQRDEPIAETTARSEAIRLATRITDMNKELADNRAQIDTLVRASQAAPLLNHVGIAAINAAVILIAWSHPGRIHSEAAFAVLAGVAPITASSGNTTRHRLSRYGDRRLNQALNSIVLTRLRFDQATRDYQDRRLAEGLSSKEIRRILKRYIARQIFRKLANPTT